MFYAIVIAMVLLIIGIIYICAEVKFYKTLYYQSEKDIIAYNIGKLTKEELINNCAIRKATFSPLKTWLSKYQAYAQVYMKVYMK